MKARQISRHAADSLRLVERFVPEPWADSSQLGAVPLNYSDKELGAWAVTNYAQGLG
jgi:hypothetical protein